MKLILLRITAKNMKKTITYISILVLGLWIEVSIASSETPEPFGRYLCNNPHFYCMDTPPNQDWIDLWPNDRQRDLVMRLNRTNVAMKHRAWIVVPKEIKKLSLMDISPFPNVIEDPAHDKIIVVDKRLQAFGAYNEQGYLIYWGPATVGRKWCPDLQSSCLTPNGNYRIYRKEDASCVSKSFPVGEGGTP